MANLGDEPSLKGVSVYPESRAVEKDLACFDKRADSLARPATRAGRRLATRHCRIRVLRAANPMSMINFIVPLFLPESTGKIFEHREG